MWKNFSYITLFLLVVASAVAGGDNSESGGLFFLSSTKKTTEPKNSDKTPDFIKPQERGKTYPQVLKKKNDLKNSEPVSIRISLSKQRVYVFIGNQLAIDSPISSGKRTGMTPVGAYTVLEKDIDHHSTIYGNFIDRQGHIVKAGVSSKIDSAPSGSHFEGAPMAHFMRLTQQGIGLHAGYLPGYPASHGCVRLPPDMAAMIYDAVPLNTPVIIEQ